MERNNNLNVKSGVYKNSIPDYLNLIRSNILTILIISLIIVTGTLIYAIFAPDIYVTSTTLKITNDQRNILESPFDPQGSTSMDLFIANEIETIKNVTIREQVARVILDSIKSMNQLDDLNLVLKENSIFENNEPTLKSDKSIAGILLSNVEMLQKPGLNFLEIIVESPSPTEAAIIANAYANVYKEFNLMESRKQLTQIKEFLTVQKEEKFNELLVAEDNIRLYQLQGGGIELDKQASTMVETLSKFEAEKNAVQIETSIEKRKLDEYKRELNERDPSLTNYFDLQSAQPSIEMLQQEIANIETQRAIAISGKANNAQKDLLVKEFDNRLAELKKKLREDISAYQSKIYAASPNEVKDLSQKIFESEVKIQALQSQEYQLNQVINNYEREFESLPKKTLDLARLAREKQSLEKLYLVLEDKYQEALLNEQSIPGNVLILNPARVPYSPEKPNRVRIVLLGLIAGLFISIAFVYVRNLLDKTVKTPEDIEQSGLYVLASIPKFDAKLDGLQNESEIFMNSKNELAASEAYRGLRTRILFSKLTNSESKSILITSSAPQEGKTTVAVNLAASFAQSNRKVIILDCDLRIPRVHSVFKGKSSPGFTNFLFGQATFEDILRKSTVIDNLFYIAAGTIPSNPSEILGSQQMEDFLNKLKSEFDLIIVDAPPVMTITDAEVLSHRVDITILVVFANKTEVEWMTESADLLQKGGQKSYAGVVLNNFDYNTGYRSYHKYNTSKYYKRADETKQKEWIKNA